MFRFAYPEYLWLLWLLPLLVAVWTAAGQLARRRLSRMVAETYIRVAKNINRDRKSVV